MAGEQLKSVASLLLFLNFCMFVVVLGIGGWGDEPSYRSRFHHSSSFFLSLSLTNIVSSPVSTTFVPGTFDSLPSAASAAAIAWSLTLLAMGFACKEIELEIRNAKLPFTVLHQGDEDGDEDEDEED
ncbi:AWPM-19-like family protein [Actinidia rufa]|uniref:AWPM-19-like family protein n=1 Tax=Actinidia rufa TaxID=165716 RepID=A0A7J0G8Q2_9ERIC|nr:AWPM-19-like family protein [Actinidia rufa]